VSDLCAHLTNNVIGDVAEDRLPCTDREATPQRNYPMAIDGTNEPPALLEGIREIEAWAACGKRLI
jgi:hypothetical protein